MEAGQYQGECQCRQCGHSFDRPGAGEVCCPRCGGEMVECSPFLFETSNPTPGDYWAVCAPPCCCGTSGRGK